MPAHCESCGDLPAPGKPLNLDHCHITLTFRGWLCHACNHGIGLLGDNLTGVLKAAQYLVKTQE